MMMGQKQIKKLNIKTKRMKFSWKHLRKWIYSVETSNIHYSSENYYSYYIKTYFLGHLSLKKVIVYFEEKTLDK